MAKIFEKIGVRTPKKSSFDLSHERKFSFNMGQLIPCYLQEILPSDRFSVKTETMLRLAPMIAPIMHRVDVTVHYFFVPNRILWSGWEDFITGGKDGLSAPAMPTMNSDSIAAGSFAVGSLADYLGVPIRDSGDEYDTASAAFTPISQLPFRAYQAIYNEYYRDETLQDEIAIDSGSSRSQLSTLRNRCWQKDYFTSSLPFTQRGPRVELPFETLAETSDIVYNAQSTVKTTAGTNPGITDIGSNFAGGLDTVPAGTGLRIENIDEITGVGGVDINDFRVAHRLQRWLETQARGGYRYIETLLSQFNQKSSDARLQRPEYLGGGRQNVIISEVLNTTGTTEAPQGQMSGHGISAGQTNSFSKQFEEHGYVLGILSVMPKTAYMQGMPKHFGRIDKLDYAWPEFAHLGEQEIKNSELYIPSSGAISITDSETFGYQQRYAEYKYAEDTVHGDFRTSYDFYHMARKFSSRPSLNEAFVKSDPTHRIFAVDDEDPTVHKLWCQIYNNVKADRPLPYFGIPTL